MRERFGLALSLLSALLAGAAQGASTPLIYEVRSPTNTVYLFGTVHVGTRALYPLSPQVEQAFAASRALALEANPLDQQEAAAAMAYAMYKPPDDLSKHISPKLFERVKEAVAPHRAAGRVRAHDEAAHAGHDAGDDGDPAAGL